MLPSLEDSSFLSVDVKPGATSESHACCVAGGQRSVVVKSSRIWPWLRKDVFI